MEATVEFCNDRTATAQCRITCDGVCVADTSLMFGFIPKHLLAAGFEDEVLRNYLAVKGVAAR
jgi:hypothetical protein